jgi:hypothetical protein
MSLAAEKLGKIKCLKVEVFTEKAQIFAVFRLLVQQF